jgi:hypothetical protein
MFAHTRILLVLVLGMILSGCVGGIKPEVRSFNLEGSEASLLGHIVLKRRVVLERTTKTQQLQWFEEKTVDEIATSRFGNEHEIANVDCVVTGLRNVLKNSILVSSDEFWGAIGRDIETLNLSSLFEEQYSHAADLLNLDYLVITYHQRFDVISVFIENLIEGAYRDEDREVVFAVIIDMKSKGVIDAIEINATHNTIVGHITPIPFALFTYPDEDPCNMAGRLAAEAISRSITTNKIPRIAVVAGDLKTAKQSYENELHLRDLQRRAMQGDVYAQWDLYDEYSVDDNLIWLCRAADQGHLEARNELAKLYFYGSEKYQPDISRSCMWSHLAGLAQITDQAEIGDFQLISIPYKSPEVERTVEAMTEHEREEADKLLQAWKPGQCYRELSSHSGADPKINADLAGLCMEADHGSFAARYELGRMYSLGLSGVEVDLLRTYMWHQLAERVYVPPFISTSAGITQFLCDSMTMDQQSTAKKLLEEWEPGKCEKELIQ